MKKLKTVILLIASITCSLFFLSTNINADDTLWNYYIGESIQEVKISNDGNTIILFDASGTLTVLDQFGNLKWTNKFTQSRYNVPNIGSIAISSDGTTIATSCLQEHEYGRIETKCFDQNGETLWSNSYYGNLELSRIRSSLSLSSDGQLLTFIGMVEDNRSGFLYHRNGTEIWLDDQKIPTEIKISGNGKFILIEENSGFWEPSRYGRLHYLSKEKTVQWSEEYDIHYTSSSISFDGFTIATTLEDGQLYVLNQRGDKIFSYSANPATQLVVDVSADGSSIALGSNENQVIFFNRNGSTLWNYETTSAVQSVSLSENGSSLAAGCENGMVYLLSKEGNLLWSYKTPNSAKVSISNDGNNLAIGSEDKNVYFIPEFPSFTILAIMCTISLLMTFYKKRITSRRNNIS
ncbi:MAG: DUF5711 family protein [Candidatus Bathyarchaeota archaeon]|nr:DUF5711 family protein [Candidatus Bathyarchaeum tardum]